MLISTADVVSGVSPLLLPLLSLLAPATAFAGPAAFGDGHVHPVAHPTTSCMLSVNLVSILVVNDSMTAELTDATNG